MTRVLTVGKTTPPVNMEVGATQCLLPPPPSEDWTAMAVVFVRMKWRSRLWPLRMICSGERISEGHEEESEGFGVLLSARWVEASAK